METRVRLLATTARLIAKEGILGLRFSQIAKLAKVPQALMSYHFPSLESLLLELVQGELEKLRSLSVERVERYSHAPKRALVEYIRAPFDLAARDPEFRGVWTGFYHLASVSRPFADLNTGIRKVGRERVINLITMVMAIEGFSLGERKINRETLEELGLSVNAIITGYGFIAGTETGANYAHYAERAVSASFALLSIDAMEHS